MRVVTLAVLCFGGRRRYTSLVLVFHPVLDSNWGLDFRRDTNSPCVLLASPVGPIRIRIWVGDTGLDSEPTPALDKRGVEHDDQERDELMTYLLLLPAVSQR
ncbi:hypothetical protein B296_00048361 [Ensete ventricosum]|uniref:Uncharacterized protein n=1 Tax=Ensete ventricosum TaxID=4639 RepID=A0A426Y0Z8_ENSVE|nr:hypothetical protein B296_00048361 [Ensete ventricosum]